MSWLPKHESEPIVAKKKVTKLIQELSFDQMDLSDEMKTTLANIGYVKPTPIQAGLIPLALEEYDVVGQARTGTGKTAAFSIPIIEMIELGQKNPRPQALIMTPTRELAVQVESEIQKLSAGQPISSVCVYGGRPIRQQINKLNRGAHIVVGTPGRVLDLIKRGALDLQDLWLVVLDEADRMLDIGFRPDIERILKRCPDDRQTLFLSATVPQVILGMVKRYMHRPKLINFSNENLSADTIEQFQMTVPEEMKFDVLLKLLEREEPDQSIVFCRTKLGTERLYRKLLKKGGLDDVGTIHGDMGQSARDRMMKSFREETIKILVATDVVGRGIDITNVSHIINYDVPELSDDYVHRVGRTGRMGKQGVAFTFVTPYQAVELSKIEQKINAQLQVDPMQEEIDDIRRETEPAHIVDKKPKKKYRRAL